MSEINEREAFEAWADTLSFRAYPIDWNENGGGHSTQKANIAWQAWQARAALSASSAPVVTNMGGYDFVDASPAPSGEVEAVEVVAHFRWPLRGSNANMRFLIMGGIPVDLNRKLFDAEPLMTVAQCSRIVAAKDAEIAELEQKIIGLEDAFASNLDYLAMYRQLRAQLASQQQAEPLIDTSAWQSCNPGCDPEFNGEKGRHCVCDPAKAAMSAKKANSINPEMVDVVGYTTAGMLRISKDLPLTGRLGAKCKPDERWNVPLMTVAQYQRHMAAKDAEIAGLRQERADLWKTVDSYEKHSSGIPALAEIERLRAQLAAQQAAVPEVNHGKD